MALVYYTLESTEQASNGEIINKRRITQTCTEVTKNLTRGISENDHIFQKSVFFSVTTIVTD